MNRINDHLMKYGYNLQYSLDDNLCSEALINHLGKKGYKKFWNFVLKFANKNGTEGIEQVIRDYIGTDSQHLKILLSGQILISVMILEGIISSMQELKFQKNQELQILELGGYEGWAADYINCNEFNSSFIDVIDSNYNGPNANTNLRLIQTKYETFNSEKKYDVVFSILGIHHTKIKILFDCIDRNTTKDSVILLGLRVDKSDYIDVVDLFSANGYMTINYPVKTIKVQNLGTGPETFPLFEFRK